MKKLTFEGYTNIAALLLFGPLGLVVVGANHIADRDFKDFVAKNKQNNETLDRLDDIFADEIDQYTNELLKHRWTALQSSFPGGFTSRI